MNRRFFFNLHSWIGIKFCLLLFIVCFSGTMATISHEMDWLFIKAMRVSPTPNLASKNLVLANIQKHDPNSQVVFWENSREPYLCDIVHVLKERHRSYLLINPYNGVVQGQVNLTFQRFFRDLHYYFFIPFYQIGHFGVLFFGFILFASGVSSLVFYKKWYLKFFSFKKSRKNLGFIRNLHRIIGLWSLPFLFLFSITGFWYFIERANLFDIDQYLSLSVPAIQPLDTSISSIDGYSLDLDRAIDSAKYSIPNLEIQQMLLPTRLDQPIYLNGQSHVPLVRSRANRVYIDHWCNYKVIHVQKAEELNPATYINDIVDPLHFGYWGGIVTKILWFFGGLAISSLVGTGVWIGVRRKLIKSKQGQSRDLMYWKFINYSILTIILGFMYRMLICVYKVSGYVLGLIGIMWLLLFTLIYYIFIIRIQRGIKK